VIRRPRGIDPVILRRRIALCFDGRQEEENGNDVIDEMHLGVVGFFGVNSGSFITRFDTAEGGTTYFENAFVHPEFVTLSISRILQ
jgi:hypothetical protein